MTRSILLALALMLTGCAAVPPAVSPADACPAQHRCYLMTEEQLMQNLQKAYQLGVEAGEKSRT